MPVDVVKFCTIAATLLEKDKNGKGNELWRMRTVREIREERGMAIPLNKDSLYKEVERGAPIFAPLKIPRKLEGSLPFASKPKQDMPKQKGVTGLRQRRADMKTERAVVVDAKEKKERQLLQAVYKIRKDRLTKKKESREQKLEEKKREWQRDDAKHAASSKANKKRKFALDGAREARDAKKGRKGDEE